MNTKTPGSIISCHLCACDQFQCLRLGGTVCVSVCLRCYWMAVLVWESQYRLEQQRLSVALFPHYPAPSSLQSGPAPPPLAAQACSFVFVLRSHTHKHKSAEHVICLSSLGPQCLLLKICQPGQGEVLGKSCTIIGFQIPPPFHSVYFVFTNLSGEKVCVCVYIKCTMSVSSRPHVGSAVVLS